MSVDSYLGMAKDEGALARIDREELERRLGALRTACRQAGVRLTPQRLEIFREVAERLDHPDAESVFREIRKRMPTVSPDTVYRTLAMLKSLGLVVALGPRRESVRFDAHTTAHDHYVCLRCGMTRDIPGARDEIRLDPKDVAHLGSIVSTQVEIRGVCRKCERELAQQGAARRRRGAT